MRDVKVVFQNALVFEHRNVGDVDIVFQGFLISTLFKVPFSLA
jgi:hypothetical protein